MFRLLRRHWMPLLLVVVILVGGYAIICIRHMFTPDVVASSGEQNGDNSNSFNAKRVTYEITGTPGSSVSINYLDENGQPNLVDPAALPWSFTIVTTLPSMSANIVAQASTGVSNLGCRVVVDGQVRDDRSDSGYEPFIYCLVKSV